MWRNEWEKTVMEGFPMISPWKSGDVLHQWIGLRKNKYWNPSSNFRGKKQLVGSFSPPL
jgi:hypothetical protein